MKQRIYLDNNGTTPLASEVIEEMLLDLNSTPRNPSSLHSFGQEGKKLLTKARHKIASFLQVKMSEIYFTSGGTESMNLLIKGAVERLPSPHIITSTIEHPCVYNTIQELEKRGAEVSYLSPTPYGAPQKEQIEKALSPNTSLIALSAVNSETGVKLPLEEIAPLAKHAGVPLIIDGVALLGKEHFTIPDGVSGMGFSAHKIHGPKGIGFIYKKRGFSLIPQQVGGAQESGMRGGTENLSGILGLAKAVELLLESSEEHLRELRDLFEKELISKGCALQINGEGPRISNTSNLYFRGVDGESLLIALDMAGIAAAQGAACSSGALEPSRILLNMGYSKERANSSLRFSFSRMNTKEEILRAAQVISSTCRSIGIRTP